MALVYFYQEKLHSRLVSKYLFFSTRQIIIEQALNASTVLRALTTLLNFHHSPCEVGIKIPMFQHEEMKTQRGWEMTVMASKLECADTHVHTVLLSKEGPQSTKNLTATAPFQDLSARAVWSCRSQSAVWKQRQFKNSVYFLEVWSVLRKQPYLGQPSSTAAA